MRHIPFVFAGKCPYCGDVLEEGENECSVCRLQFYKFRYRRKLSDDIECIAPFRYDGSISDAIVRFKKSGCRQFAESCGEQISHLLNYAIPPDIVTCVPMYWLDKWTRGFNHAEKIARCTARIHKLPYAALLRKKRHNQTQHKLNAEQRKQNILGVFEAVNLPQIEGKRVLIVDDVCTTGFTLEECGKMLRLAGAESILCAVAALGGRRMVPEVL